MCQSSRSARIGCTNAARAAGTSAAMRAIATSTTTATLSAWPDPRRDPIEHRRETRAKMSASTRPHAHAIPATRSCCAINCWTMSRRNAPSARRNADLAPSTADGVAQGAVDARRKRARAPWRKQRQQRGPQTVLRVCVADSSLQWSDVVDGTERLQLFELQAYRLNDRCRVALRANEEVGRRALSARTEIHGWTWCLVQPAFPNVADESGDAAWRHVGVRVSKVKAGNRRSVRQGSGRRTPGSPSTLWRHAFAGGTVCPRAAGFVRSRSIPETRHGFRPPCAPLGLPRPSTSSNST